MSEHTKITEEYLVGIEDHLYEWGEIDEESAQPLVDQIRRQHEITAAFLDAVTGDESPQLWRLAWLETLLTEICESQFIESHDDPSAAGDMVRECRELAKGLRVAMEKAQGGA